MCVFCISFLAFLIGCCCFTKFLLPSGIFNHHQANLFLHFHVHIRIDSLSLSLYLSRYIHTYTTFIFIYTQEIAYVLVSKCLKSYADCLEAVNAVGSWNRRFTFCQAWLICCVLAFWGIYVFVEFRSISFTVCSYLWFISIWNLLFNFSKSRAG